MTGPLTVSLLANYTNVPVGYPVSFTALIEGRTTESVWDFGDGDVAINQPYVTHGWPKAGDYLVALWAFNESQFSGVSATCTVHVVAQPVLMSPLQAPIPSRHTPLGPPQPRTSSRRWMRLCYRGR